ncbi:Hemolysin C [Aquimixticola soesokkakensis]|uniref:Hemolysin C n=1 Tax=Aquimixticola soesokkakensis TaxID=1519096 RepID=A0A1Y5TDC1_9RHOB|nr:hemolysin family protein [Aquimixticola soesokkakensis]SLN59329.1 Hemolysin C [Aquimixticola soesokkakensis]
MGDTDAGSRAAPRAQSLPPSNQTPVNDAAKPVRSSSGKQGFWSRLGLFSKAADHSAASSPATAPEVRKFGILNLRRMSIEDVYIPKADIVAVPSDIKKDDLVQVFRESGMTRLPVYKGTLDTPLGLIHLKDFALTHGFNGGGGRFNLKAILRPLLFAPPSMPIGVMLTKMQTERTHMALVIDEYGGVDGLVTLEDLVEQVIGEIEDEHDIDEGVFWSAEKPGVYIAQAKTPLQDFEAAIGLKLVDEEDEEEIDTLGGLAFMLAGRVPARGEVIPHDSGAEFTIVDADPRRIKRIRVRLPDGTGQAGSLSSAPTASVVSANPPPVIPPAATSTASQALAKEA